MKKNIIIIILVILSISLSGYIIYDKTNNKEIKQEQNNDISNNTQTSNNTIINKEIATKFSGNYYYEKVTSDNICPATNDKPKEKIEFELKEDGTYTYNYGIDCGGGYLVNGNYYFGLEKILLIATNDCTGNCVPTHEINYTLLNNSLELYIIQDNNKIIFEKNKNLPA